MLGKALVCFMVAIASWFIGMFASIVVLSPIWYESDFTSGQIVRSGISIGIVLILTAFLFRGLEEIVIESMGSNRVPHIVAGIAYGAPVVWTAENTIDWTHLGEFWPITIQILLSALIIIIYAMSYRRARKHLITAPKPNFEQEQ